MMNLSEIISTIQNSGIENADTLTKKITDYTKELQKSHDKETTTLTRQIETLVTAVGIDRGTIEEKIAAANNAIAKLTSENSTLKADKEELSGILTKTQKDVSISKAAAVAKVNSTVLAALIKEEELKFEGEQVLVDGKELKVWAQDVHAPFMSALFPTDHSSPPYSDAPAHSEKKAETKSNLDSSKSNQEKSAAEQHIDRFYKRPDFVM